jgi:CDP-diacylglycerol--serine O-phosphatidyltransferase
MGWVTSEGFSALPNLMTAVALIAAMSLVSTLPYWSMKEVHFFKRHALTTLLGAIGLMTILFREPENTLFLIGIVYLLSGPTIWLFKRKKKLREEAAA